MNNMITYTGIKFDPINPNIELINIKDIAHALSLICRANGHIKHFYSIAQHSINCALEAKARNYSIKVQLLLLLHDASEAYISDIIRPVKPHLTNYLNIEAKLQQTIYKKYINSELVEDDYNKIKEVDDDILMSELYILMNRDNLENHVNILCDANYEYMQFSDVEQTFIDMFNDLTSKIIESKVIKMEAKQTIITRRSVRKYSDKPIDRELIKEIIDVVRFAPTWKNCQGTRYHVLDNKDKLIELANMCTYEGSHNVKMISRCSSLVILTTKNVSGISYEKEYDDTNTIDWNIFDSGIAAQTLSLTAHDYGLGSVIVGVFKNDVVHKYCNLPEDEKVIALLPMGYPLDPSVKEGIRYETEELLTFID